MAIFNSYVKLPEGKYRGLIGVIPYKWMVDPPGIKHVTSCNMLCWKIHHSFSLMIFPANLHLVRGSCQMGFVPHKTWHVKLLFP